MSDGKQRGGGILFLLSLSLSGCGNGSSDRPLPTVPGALLLAVIGAERIDLTWGDSLDEAGYVVERSPDGLTWMPIASLPADTTAYAALGLAPATTWWFRIQAWNGEGAVFSNAPSAPTLARAWDSTWNPAPVPRAEHSAVYDPNGANPRMVVFGGNDDMLTYLDTTVALDLSVAPNLATWTSLATGSALTPPARRAHSAVYDPNAGNPRMVVFGGEDGTFSLEDVWVLDLTTEEWTSPGVTGAPGPRAGHTAAYDPNGGNPRMLVYGGLDLDLGLVLGDVWALSLGGATPFTWTTLYAFPGATSPTDPAPRYFHAAYHDPNPGGQSRMIVFGGNDEGDGGTLLNSEAWSFSLSGGGWTLLVPTGTTPSDRESMSGIYDGTNQHGVIFGGLITTGTIPPFQPLDELLFLGPGTGAAWSTPATTSAPPSARYRHSAVLDPSGPRLLIFGGTDGAGSFYPDVISLQL